MSWEFYSFDDFKWQPVDDPNKSWWYSTTPNAQITPQNNSNWIKADPNEVSVMILGKNKTSKLVAIFH